MQTKYCHYYTSFNVQYSLVVEAELETSECVISAAKLHIVFVELNLGAKKVLFLYLSVLLFCFF